MDSSHRRGTYTGRHGADPIGTLAAAQEEVAELGPDLRSALALVCRHTRELTGSDGAGLYLLEDDELVCVSASGRTEAIVGLRVPATKIFAGRCVGDETRTAVCNDSYDDIRSDREVAERLGVRSMLCHPIYVGTVQAGVLEASSSKPGAYGADALATMRLLAGLVAAAFRNAAHVKTRRPDAADPVTGLPDSTTYRYRLRMEVERSRRTGAPIGLAVMRLIGYYDADALAIVAEALHGLRSIDEVFLADGGTFAILMPDTPLAGALIAARKIAATVTDQLADLGIHVRVGAAQRDDLDPESLHQAAWRAAGGPPPRAEFEDVPISL